MTWQDRAACQGLASLFFPTIGKDGKDLPFDPEPAIAVCDTCPVSYQCLEYVLAKGEHVGVWAGFYFESRQPTQSSRICAGCGRARQGRNGICMACTDKHEHRAQLIEKGLNEILA